MTQSEWIDIIRAVSPVLAALLAGGVAWKFGSIQAGIARQQAATAASAAATARNKLKLDLFERRLAVYKIAQDSSLAITRFGRDGETAALDYFNGISAARWLFGEDVVNYLQKDLKIPIVGFRTATDEMRDMEPGESKEKLSTVQVENRDAFFANYNRINEVFSPYLKLEA